MRPQSLAALLAVASLAAAAPAAAAPLRAQASAFEVQVLVDGLPAPTFEHAGETYVLGNLGDRYTIRVINHSARRIEAVASVDGRDVVDGKPGDYRVRRGYVVPAYGSVDIEGWRLSHAQAAAFRFSRVSSSYAARIGRGRDVGVVGVAVFSERPAPRPILVAPPPPYDWGPRFDRAPAAAESAPTAPRTSAAPAAPGALGGIESQRPVERPGLGTEFGESVSSPVQEVSFVRQSPARPDAILGVRYNDRDGLLAMGVDVDRCGCDCTPGCADEPEVRRTAEPFPVADRNYATPPPGWAR